MAAPDIDREIGELRRSIEEMRNGLKSLADRASDGAADVLDEGRVRARRYGDAADRLGDEASVRARRGAVSVRSGIEDHPLASLSAVSVLTFILGFVLGRVLDR